MLADKLPDFEAQRQWLQNIILIFGVAAQHFSSCANVELRWEFHTMAILILLQLSTAVGQDQDRTKRSEPLRRLNIDQR
jgi:hypothetical protein